MAELFFGNLILVCPGKTLKDTVPVKLSKDGEDDILRSLAKVRQFTNLTSIVSSPFKGAMESAQLIANCIGYNREIEREPCEKTTVMSESEAYKYFLSSLSRLIGDLYVAYKNRILNRDSFLPCIIYVAHFKSLRSFAEVLFRMKQNKGEPFHHDEVISITVRHMQRKGTFGLTTSFRHDKSRANFNVVRNNFVRS